jgi:PAS domain S-box-containing protein
MSWHFTPFAIPLFAGAALALSITIRAWQRRSTPGALYILLGGIALIFYLVGYAFELGSTSTEAIMFWLRIQYIGVTTAPTILFCLILAYTGKQHFLAPIHLALLFFIPMCTLAFAWTNDLHHWIWRESAFEVIGGATITSFTRGSWYWVSVSYNWVLPLIGIALLIQRLATATGINRRQLWLLIIGAVIPMPVYAIYLARVLPINLDLNTFSLLATCACFAIAIFNYHLFELSPAARDAIFTRLHDAIIVLDSQNRIADLNNSARNLLGPEVAKATGRSAAEVFTPWPDLLAAYQATTKTHNEVVIKVGDEQRYFDIQVSALEGPGWSSGRVLVLRDVTQRVSAEEALQNSLQRLIALRHVDAELVRRLDVSYVATIAIDAAMRLSGADAGFINLIEETGVRTLDMLGLYMKYRTEAALASGSGITGRVQKSGQGERILDLSSDPDYLQVIPDMKAQISVPLNSGETTIGVITLETSNPAHFSEEIFEVLKLLAARIATAIDNARMYEERAGLVEDLRAFAATVAHDLKTPITNVVGYATLITQMKSQLSEEMQLTYLERTVQSAHKAAAIIDALMLLARVRASREVEIDAVDMPSVLTETRSRVDFLLKETGGTLEMPEEWPVARGYAPWVEEIWVNYISNGLKYGGSPPNVKIGFSPCDDDSVRFWVRDNGQGVALEAQDQLFKPFSRLDETSSIEGHGLGLSIVHRIAERLGGSVGVESKPGEGSLFYFTLPAVPKEETASA